MKSSEFRTLIDVILNFYALHNSVWVDLWPYSNGNITISLFMNINLGHLGGASVIAKFHS